ncbi:7-deoxyloganetin glucosyltransferase-like [Chenopodium quinoa]|uniref:Glycosyltransferase n=1 Tax=Chenopodium quinoa TaxID=63459 RepID=A0A803ME89_CHEQI|nr:7-deoxyloganetin glucosyltransferase-like [Chenopodium quinoa]
MGSLIEVKNEAKVHVVCVPFPAQGHISPMLNLAKLLHTKGIHITFVNTEFNHSRFLRSRGPNFLDGLPSSFRFEAIPDGIPPSDPDATQDVPAMFHAVLNYCLEPFKKLLVRLNDEEGTPRVTYILSDCIMPFTQDAAREVGDLPVVLLWTASACGFLGYAQYRPLLEKGIVPFKDPNFLTNGCLDTIVNWVPSMEGIRLKDIPSFIRTMKEDDILLYLLMISVEKSCKSSSPVIFNTFDALEQDVLNDISKIMVGPTYTIGPLHFLIKQNINQLENNNGDCGIKSLRSNLWKEDKHCLQWLDSMKPNSVLYVSFGSITTMTNENLVEFAWGLANSKHPFLWIVRPDIVTGDSAILPSDFLVETKDRGMLASWCDQEKVLNHQATGAFLTHCGWNSTLDTICGGKPVLCWPFFAEQQTNCWYFCNKWGMGMEINKDVKRDEVERQVIELMEGKKGEEMCKNALKWKKLAEESTMPTGSSCLNLEQLMNQVFIPLKN